MAVDTQTVIILPTDPDSPDQPNLTPLGLQRFLNVLPDWVEKNTQARKIPGMGKAGRLWRYRRAEIELHRLRTGRYTYTAEEAKKAQAEARRRAQ